MKCCVACGHAFAGELLQMSAVSRQPATRDDIVRFVEDPPGRDGGFKIEFFAKLAGFEEGHFSFRARNRLLQWAARHYFPGAKNFLEIGCGTGFVLKGLHDTMPLLSIAGSEILWGGLQFAGRACRARTCFKWMRAKFPSKKSLTSSERSTFWNTSSKMKSCLEKSSELPGPVAAFW